MNNENQSVSLQKKHFQTKKSRFYCLYTLVFLFVTIIAFWCFIYYGKSMIWSTSTKDGLVQHYNSLLYYGDFLRSIVKSVLIDHTFTLPMFTYNVGFGADIITTLHYYVLGDPLNLLSVFVPSQYTELLYEFLIILRLYLAGVAFSFYCFEKKQESNAVLIGTIIYVFGGFALYASVRHPFFINPMIYLPFLCVGVDRIIHHQSPLIFTVFVSIAIMSNFYFFYINVVLVVLYAVFSFLSESHEKIIKELFSSIGKCIFYAIIGIGIGCIIFLPTLLVILKSSRADVPAYIPMLYDSLYYFSLFSNMFAMKTTSHWSITALAAPAFFGIITMFLRRGHTSLKAAYIFLTVCLMIPACGYIFNAMGYVSNRWIYAYAFLIAYIFVVYFNELLDTIKKYKWVYILVFIVYSAMSFYGGMIYLYPFIAFMIIFGIMFILGLIIKQRIKLFTTFVIILTIISIGINAHVLYSAENMNYEREFIKTGEAFEELTVNKGALTPEFQTTGYRYDEQRIQPYALNKSMNTKRATPSFFFSLCEGNVINFLKEMRMPGVLGSLYDGVNYRTYLESLSSVKYYVASSKNPKVPYGFIKDEAMSDGENDIYINQYALPLGYTYNQTINQDYFESLTPLQKQQVMLQGAVVENGVSSSAIFNDQELDFNVVNNEHVRLENQTFIVNENKSKVIIEFTGLPESETYLSFENLLYDFENSDISSASIRVNGSFGRETIMIRSQRDSYYDGTVDYLNNLGYSSQRKTKVELVFSNKGVYSFDQLSIIAQPMINYAEQVNELKKESLENVTIGTNKVSGNITIDISKVLTFSIPYSEGWTIKVDGHIVEKEVVNKMFLGTRLEAGNHKVELIYVTPGLKIGTLMSAASIVALTIALLIRKRYHQMKSN